MLLIITYDLLMVRVLLKCPPPISSLLFRIVFFLACDSPSSLFLKQKPWSRGLLPNIIYNNIGQSHVFPYEPAFDKAVKSF